MDHRRIEEENIADLYAAGGLSPEDEEAFEIHLLECRECRERVAWADDFRGSVRAAVAEDAARAAVRAGLLGWLVRSRAARVGLVTALTLAVALSASLLIDRARLRRELAAARTPAEKPVPQPPAPGRDPEDAAERERLARERDGLEEELRRERAEREDLAARIARLTRPQANPALYSLGLVRGESSAGDVEVGSSPEWIVLSLELPRVEHEAYRATLLDARGAEVWRGEGLRPTASDTLAVLVYSDLLQPGSYRFRLEGLEAGGRSAPAGEIPFRVRRRG